MGWGNESLLAGLGHMTKMAATPLYGKNIYIYIVKTQTRDELRENLFQCLLCFTFSLALTPIVSSSLPMRCLLFGVGGGGDLIVACVCVYVFQVNSIKMLFHLC